MAVRLSVLVTLLFGYVTLTMTMTGHNGISISVWNRLENRNGHYFDVEPKGKQWTYRSVVSCVHRCYQSLPNCRAVAFDELTGSCVYGDWVTKSRNTSNQGQGHSDVYVWDKSVVCDGTLGFAVYREGDTSACVFVSEVSMDKTDAEKDCGKREGTLYTIKTADKFDILVRASQSVQGYKWVGLADVHQNRSFYWADGELLDPTSTLWSLVWQTNQPDNIMMDQFCVVSNSEYSKLHDEYCSHSHLYVCERVGPQVE